MTSIDYRVCAGDTLSKIAQQHAVSVDVLAQINNITNINLIRIGQNLKIPTSLPGRVSSQQTHRVFAGETMYKIAQRYGVTVEELTWTNQITNPNLIRIGQVLLIPNSTQAVPTQPVQKKPVKTDPVVKQTPVKENSPKKGTEVRRTAGKGTAEAMVAAALRQVLQLDFPRGRRKTIRPN